MMEMTITHQLLPPSLQSNRGLFNPFSNIHATPEQSHDLLNYRDIGNRQFEQYITHRINCTSTQYSTCTSEEKKVTYHEFREATKEEGNEQREGATTSNQMYKKKDVMDE